LGAEQLLTYSLSIEFPTLWIKKFLTSGEHGLFDQVVGALGISEVDVRVRKDHAFGWQPTVISSPGDSIGYQRRVEEIANRLRFHFDLRE
jgi:hypothetical protein